MPGICIGPRPPNRHCHPSQVEIAFASWHVPRVIAITHTGCLPSAQLGNGTCITTVPCQAGLQLPNPERERSPFTNIHMASQVRLHSTANQGRPTGSGTRNRTNGRSAPSAAARGSATSCTPPTMNWNWPQRPNTTKMGTRTHRNYLHCEDPDASIAQSID